MRMSHDPTRRPAHGQLGKSAAIVTAYEEEREGWGKICMGCSGWAVYARRQEGVIVGG
jgi:hypothetical protein